MPLSIDFDPIGARGDVKKNESCIAQNAWLKEERPNYCKKIIIFTAEMGLCFRLSFLLLLL